MPKNAPAFCTQRRDPLPERQLAGDLLRREALALEVLAEDDVDQVEAEKADAPEADHSREGQHHADDRVPPPARVAEELGQRAELVLCRPAVSSSPAAAFQRSGSLSRERSEWPARPGASPIRNMIRQELWIVPRLFELAQHEVGRAPPACCRPPRALAASPARRAATGPTSPRPPARRRPRTARPPPARSGSGRTRSRIRPSRGALKPVNAE